MTANYTKTLGPGIYDGVVDGINVTWSPTGDGRLDDIAATTGVAKATLKDLSEHFAVVVAKSLENSKVKIMGPPHDFTIDSTTNVQSDDDLHIRVSASGPTRGGQHNVHIYLAGEGDTGSANMYDNLHLHGQAVWSKTKAGRPLNVDLSTSNYCPGGTWELPS